MTNPSRTYTYSLSLTALVVLMTFLLSGCVETKYTIRQVDQHPAGDFNTVETSGERTISIPYIYSQTEYLGINFWNCLQSDTNLNCERICDDSWDRICAPEFRNEFGTVSRPGAGVVMARARANQRPEPAVAEQPEEEQELDEETDELAAEDDDADPEENSEEEVSE